jgi:hypothetical protein
MRKLIHRLLDLASVAPGGPSSEDSEKQSDHCSPPNSLGRSSPVQRSGHSKIEVRRLVGGALTTTQTCVNKLRVQAVRTIAIAVVTLPGLPGGLTRQVATSSTSFPRTAEHSRAGSRRPARRLDAADSRRRGFFVTLELLNESRSRNTPLRRPPGLIRGWPDRGRIWMWLSGPLGLAMAKLLAVCMVVLKPAHPRPWHLSRGCRRWRSGVVGGEQIGSAYQGYVGDCRWTNSRHLRCALVAAASARHCC